MVWFVDPPKRTVEAYTAPDQSHVVREEDSLDGGDVLPGLALPVRDLFARLPPAGRPARKRNGTRRPAKGKGRRRDS
jgi:hypothetical protein